MSARPAQENGLGMLQLVTYQVVSQSIRFVLGVLEGFEASAKQTANIPRSGEVGTKHGFTGTCTH